MTVVPGEFPTAVFEGTCQTKRFAPVFWIGFFTVIQSVFLIGLESAEGYPLPVNDIPQAREIPKNTPYHDVFMSAMPSSRRGNTSPFSVGHVPIFQRERERELNIILQGPHKTVIVMMDLIRAFEAKLYVFRNDITKNYKYFPNLKTNITDLDAQEKRNEEKVIDDFISIMDSLIKEFSARFSQLKELSETFKFIMYPDVISFDKLNLSQFD
ncbi:general transcription factor II-I repeat domain-containing protein 2A [Trichonephila clavipes]|nr:general transcription factor II-I repeat domain-containing protein 2A [Trichonephila clavipes]